MIVVFSRQEEVGSQVAAALQSFLGWRAVACARRPTVEIPLWRYHLDAVAGGGDTIVYGWTLPNVLAEGEAELPPNYLRRWCREVLVRGGFILHAEPQLDEEAVAGLPVDVVEAERVARKRCFDLLNNGLQGLPWSMVLSFDEDELELRAREANDFFQFARRYEMANNRRYGSGSLAPRVVLVGDAPSPHDPFAPPFGTLGGSDDYLGKLLDEAELQEGELHFLNTANFWDEPSEYAVLNLLQPEAVVLLGDQAITWWKKWNRPDHFEDKQRGVICFDHPQYLERFHHDDLKDHARRLMAALKKAQAGERLVEARLVIGVEERQEQDDGNTNSNSDGLSTT